MKRFRVSRFARLLAKKASCQNAATALRKTNNVMNT
jgi:hypothetical protein